MNRIRMIALGIVLCMSILCSCYDGARFIPQEGIGMNYNNISAYNDFWLTDESVCYLEDNLLQYYCLLDSNKKSIIASNEGFGFGKIQRYGDKIYMLDETASINEKNSLFELKCYDVNTRKIVRLCSMNNCDNYIILGDTVFYLEYKWTDGGRVKSLKKCKIDNNTHVLIEENVISFGVIGNTLFYLAEKSGCISLFKFDVDNECSSCCKELELSIDAMDEHKESVIVCYTTDHLLISLTDYTLQTSQIYVQSLVDDFCSELEVNGCIDQFVSYDKKTYYMISSDESKYSTLYMFDNQQNETFELAQILGQGSMFVGSDAGVYVLEYADNVLKYYSYKQSPQTVCKF